MSITPMLFYTDHELPEWVDSCIATCTICAPTVLLIASNNRKAIYHLIAPPSQLFRYLWRIRIFGYPNLPSLNEVNLHEWQHSICVARLLIRCSNVIFCDGESPVGSTLTMARRSAIISSGLIPWKRVPDHDLYSRLQICDGSVSYLFKDILHQ